MYVLNLLPHPGCGGTSENHQVLTAYIFRRPGIPNEPLHLPLLLGFGADPMYVFFLKKWLLLGGYLNPGSQWENDHPIILWLFY